MSPAPAAALLAAAGTAALLTDRIWAVALLTAVLLAVCLLAAVVRYRIGHLDDSGRDAVQGGPG